MESWLNTPHEVCKLHIGSTNSGPMLSQWRTTETAGRKCKEITEMTKCWRDIQTNRCLPRLETVDSIVWEARTRYASLSTRRQRRGGGESGGRKGSGRPNQWPQVTRTLFGDYTRDRMLLVCLKVKADIALTGESPPQSYGTSLATWDHTVLPATRHKWTRPA